jgi:undecaprenyl diphosphate synthase
MTMDGSQSHPLLDLSASELLRQLDLDLLPRHIAIIMDGNGRWAKRQGLPRIAGHREGLTSLREVLDTCDEVGIPIVTIYAFSHENWNRPEREISLLMKLLEQFLQQERKTFQDRHMRFLPIGCISALPLSAQNLIQRVVEETQHFTDRVLSVALSYGGRSEILEAIRHLLEDVDRGIVDRARINEETFEQYLFTSSLPDPDLLIRTSGETRISNFLLWQIAYTELYFTKTLWPDFRRRDTLLALLDYQKRERRFGRVSHTTSPHSSL